MRWNGKKLALPAVAGLLLLATAAWGEGLTRELGSNKAVHTTTAWNVSAARPGGQVVLAVILDIQKHYHINPDEPQLTKPSVAKLIPTVLTPGLVPDHVTLGAVQYPRAQDITVNYVGKPQVIKAYEGKTVLFVPVTLAPNASLGTLELTFELEVQSCNETSCLPSAKQTVKTELQVVGVDTPVTPGDTALFAGFKLSSFAGDLVTMHFFGWSFDVDVSTTLGLALLVLMAVVGGFLLNLTPCVLPVIPIKIMGLSRSAGNRARCLALGAAMSGGVVVFWLGLGLAIATAVYGFTSINMLFQRPWFTVGVGLAIAVMAVGMCGLFSLRLPNSIYLIDTGHDTLAGSVGFGVMTAVLSTPCTAPFMGAAAAWAVKQRPATTLVVFAAIGLGMALPYLVLSTFPGWARRMPRTGPASELVKQVMGLLMLAAAAYFVGVGVSGLVVTPPDPPSRLYWWGVALFLVAAGLWLAWRTVQITRSAAWRAGFCGLGLAAVVAAGAGAVELTDPGPIHWTFYTPQRLADAKTNKKVVVLEFTAEWCLNCKTLEHLVLQSPRVVAALNGQGVTPMKVDLTGDNPPGNEELNCAGAVAIPFLAVLSPEGKEVFMSDAYTPEQVLDAIKRASQ